MRKKFLFSSFFLLCITAIPLTRAQSPPENLDKYWNYRDKFKKYFIKLGADRGEGILASNRCPKNDLYNLNCGCLTGGDGLIKWADGVIWTGYYLAVLATEYALLKENNQDAGNTLKELYYPRLCNRNPKFAEFAHF